MEPGCEVYFVMDQPTQLIRMRADDPKTGVILIVSPGSRHVSQMADKSDGELLLLLNTWRKEKL